MLGMPIATQLWKDEISAALGAVRGFGGITPVCMYVTDSSPTRFVGSVFAVANRSESWRSGLGAPPLGGEE
jgi:hypothetical protein